MEKFEKREKIEEEKKKEQESAEAISGLKINHCNGITTCACLPFSKVIFKMFHELAPERSSNILSSQHGLITGG